MTVLDYLDFDLELTADGTGYRTRLIDSPVGEAESTFVVPFSDEGLENFVLKVGRTRVGVRRVGSSQQQAAETFGTALFDALLSDELRSSFGRSIDAADNAGKGLRIRLRLTEAPGLADIPWEYLYWKAQRRFLVLSAHTPLVRYVDLPRRIRPLSVTAPLRILMVVAGPKDLAPLDIVKEQANIQVALAPLIASGLVELVVLRTATLGELQRVLRTSSFHVLHFVGHGGYDQAADGGVLAFEDDNGFRHLVPGDILATILCDHSSLRLAVLNACEGARTSRLDPFAGVAQSLVCQGIPAVIAMQFEFTDAAALTFSSELYLALLDGYPVDAALAEARRAVLGGGNDVEWGTPVLYLRAKDGRIFDVLQHPTEQLKTLVHETPPGPVIPPDPEPAPTPKARPSDDSDTEPDPPPAELTTTAVNSAGGEGAPLAPVAGVPTGEGAHTVEANATPRPPNGQAVEPDWRTELLPQVDADPRLTVPAPSPEPQGATAAPRRPPDRVVAAFAAQSRTPAPFRARPAPSGVGHADGPSTDPSAPAVRPWAGGRQPPRQPPRQPTPVGPAYRPAAVSNKKGGGEVRNVVAAVIGVILVVAAVVIVRSVTGDNGGGADGDGGELSAAPGRYQLTADFSPFDKSQEMTADHLVAGGSCAVSAVWRLAWDAQFLSFLVRVTDSAVNAVTGSPSTLFRTDSVNLELGAGAGDLADSDGLRGSDRHLLFAPDGAGAAVIGVNVPSNGVFVAGGSTSGIQAVSILTDSGYVLAGVIPWGITGLTPKDGTALAANLNVSSAGADGSFECFLSTNAERDQPAQNHPHLWQQLDLRA